MTFFEEFGYPQDIKKKKMGKKRKIQENIPEGTYVCTKCGQEKPNSEFFFFNHRKTKDGIRLRVDGSCRSCRNIHSTQLRNLKEDRKNNPRPEYGDLCSICGKPVYAHISDIPYGVKGTIRWCCDHDHATGKFRGWICKHCNTGMGLLGDDQSSIEKCLHYLMEAKKR